MGKIKNFWENITTAKKAESIPFTPASAWGFKEYSPMSQSAQMKQYKSWVYSAIYKRADEVANIDLHLQKKLTNDDFKEITTHPLIDLLDRVNEGQTFFDLVNYTQIVQDLAGEAFWWVIKNEKGVPIQLYPYLQPQNMTVVPSVKEFISGYEYTIPGTSKTITFKKDEIIHFKFPDPNNPYRGLSPVKAAEIEIATHTKAGEYNYNFFENDGTPKGILAIKSGLTEKQVERLETQWNNKYQGTSNAHKLSILSGTDMSYQVVGMSQKDMDFPNLKKMSRDEILAVFQVPLAMLNPNESINRATAETAKDVFLEQVILPLMKRFTMTLNEYLVPMFDDTGLLLLDYSNKPPRNMENDMKYYDNGIRNKWLTPNEIRERENLDPYEGGDTFGEEKEEEVPEEDNKKDDKEPKKEPKDKPDKKKYIPNVPYRKRSDKEIDEDIIRTRLQEKLPDIIKAVKKKSNDWEKLGEIIWLRKEAKVKTLNAKFLEELRREFDRQRRDVKSQLTQKDLGFEFDLVKEIELMKDKFNPLMTQEMKIIYVEALRTLGFTEIINSPNFDDYINDYGTKYLNTINMTTYKAMQGIVDTAREEGWSHDVLMGKLDEYFYRTIIDRAKLITDTELNRLIGWSTSSAWADSGVIKAKRWWTALDERVCPYCESMHGKIIDVKKEWFKMGDVFRPNETDENEDPLFLDIDYADIKAPPLHARCRCTEIPITYNIGEIADMS